MAIEQQGKKLAEQGHYDLALEKYREALKPEYISSEWEKATAIGSIVHILIAQGRYEEALNEQRWFLKDKQTVYALEEKAKIKALIQYQDSGNAEPVRQHIRAIEIRYANELPPIGLSQRSPARIVDILLLNDVIGDHDAGMAFIDRILEYLYDKHPDMDRVDTAGEAAVRAKFVNKKSDPNWRGYKIIRDYLLVREAFEKDKQAGLGAKGGATRAIIQSDYFPW